MPRTTARKASKPNRSAPGKSAADSSVNLPSSSTLPSAHGHANGHAAAGLSLRQLAHELNSLLDGSMRCVGLARSSLQLQQQRNGSAAAAKASSAGQSADSIDDGLSKAHAAMRHMAALLERAMRNNGDPSPGVASSMFQSTQSLGELACELEGLLQAFAQAAGAQLAFNIPDDCRSIPAGPLGPVLMNGLRNAIEACEALGEKTPRGKLHSIIMAVARDAGTLSMSITGPTAHKPSRHGVGLALSQQIVRELGGDLALVAGNDVTILRASAPLENLGRNRHG
jgi:signal transduction histidine kinase